MGPGLCPSGSPWPPSSKASCQSAKLLESLVQLPPTRYFTIQRETIKQVSSLRRDTETMRHCDGDQ